MRTFLVGGYRCLGRPLTSGAVAAWHVPACARARECSCPRWCARVRVPAHVRACACTCLVCTRLPLPAPACAREWPVPRGLLPAQRQGPRWAGRGAAGRARRPSGPGCGIGARARRAAGQRASRAAAPGGRRRRPAWPRLSPAPPPRHRPSRVPPEAQAPDAFIYAAPGRRAVPRPSHPGLKCAHRGAQPGLDAQPFEDPRSTLLAGARMFAAPAGNYSATRQPPAPPISAVAGSWAGCRPVSCDWAWWRRRGASPGQPAGARRTRGRTARAFVCSVCVRFLSWSARVGDDSCL